MSAVLGARFLRTSPAPATGARTDHVLVVAHVHVHAHKLAEFLVKAATLLPHCRAEAGTD